MKKNILLLCAIIFICSIFSFKNDLENTDWDEYLGGADRNHYSALTQINLENVKNLKPAWAFTLPDSGQLQVNPLIINGVMYCMSSSMQVFAVNATTGKEVWRFGDPTKTWANTSRGVSYWQKGSDKRILCAIGENLWALNAETGLPIKDFGNKGKTNLHLGLPDDSRHKYVISNTPGTVFENLIIMPTRVSEDSDAAPGDIQAFDILTGEVVWKFHTIPYPGEYGYETFPKDAYLNKTIGGANNWCGSAVDKERGIIYIPTGSASYDFYGGDRKGKNLFANCLLALDVRTGKRIWHYQMIHHDIWDRDAPAPPNLLTINRNGKDIDVVAQVTKQGLVFVFDRVDGTPIYPIKEMPVPVSTLEGEQSWPTQPRPTKPLPFARTNFELTTKDLSPYAENKKELETQFNSFQKKLNSPPSQVGTLIFPGYDGGAEWGGAAVDKQGIMYVNSNEMAWVLKMQKTVKKEDFKSLPIGEKNYKMFCTVCHGEDRKGNIKSEYPSLVGITKRRTNEEILNIINNGKGKMPGFNSLYPSDKEAIISFLAGTESKFNTSKDSSPDAYQTKYRGTGYIKFLDSKGLPAIAPPWGTFNAIDLNTGEYLWKIPFGEEPSLVEKGIKNTGSENYGGPVVTASGLLFIAATKDGHLRAYNKKSGQEVWKYKLPAAAFATPSTYMVNGKQYVVIACGGTKLGTEKGNSYVAFSL